MARNMVNPSPQSSIDHKLVSLGAMAVPPAHDTVDIAIRLSTFIVCLYTYIDTFRNILKLLGEYF